MIAKEKPLTGYFYSNNSIFKEDISANAKLVYLYLSRCSDKKGISYPSLDNIGLNCSLRSRTTVSNAICELIEKGFIEKVNRRRLNGSKTSNNYIIL